MNDVAIITALSTITAAIIGAVASIVTTHIQANAQAQPSKNELLIPDSVRIYRRPQRPIGWIIFFTLASGGVGLLSGMFYARNFTSQPVIAPTNTSTSTSVPTTTQTSIQTPIPSTLTVVPFLEKIVSVSGIPYWQASGISIVAGQEAEISYISGAWCGGAGSCYDGQGAWFNRIQLGVNLDTLWASLVGRVNSSGVYYAFPIGNYYRFVSPSTGNLEFRMNDDDGSSDNSGEIQIRVKIWK